MTIESFYSLLLFWAAWCIVFATIKTQEQWVALLREALMALARVFAMVARPRRDTEALNAKPREADDGGYQFFPSTPDLREEMALPTKTVPTAWGRPHGTEQP